MKKLIIILLLTWGSTGLNRAQTLTITDAVRTGPGVIIDVQGPPHSEVVFDGWTGSEATSGSWNILSGSLVLDSNGIGTYSNLQGAGNTTAFRAKTTDANPIYSTNAFGFTFISLPGGYAGYSNPFSNWNVTELAQYTSTFLPLEDGTTAYKWDPNNSTYSSSTVFSGVWSDPELSFSVGEGAIIYSESNQDIVASGSITSGTKSFILPPSPAYYLVGPIGFGTPPNQSHNFTWSGLGFGYPISSTGANVFEINANGSLTETYVSATGTVPFTYSSAKFLQGLAGGVYQERSVTITIW